MRTSDTDKILYIQLIIARMGEKELRNWWNTDMAYEGGGGDFLQRLLGDTLAPLAAAEGIVKGSPTQRGADHGRDAGQSAHSLPVLPGPRGTDGPPGKTPVL